MLAHASDSLESRSAMNTIPRSKNRGRGFAAALVAASFLWSLALGASPQLHSLVHPDADQPGHTCAVTLVASGSFTHSAPLPLVSAPVLLVQFSTIPALTSQWVESPFLGASVFEHAPPAQA